MSPDARWRTGNAFRHQVYRGSAEAIISSSLILQEFGFHPYSWIISGVRLSAPGAPWRTSCTEVLSGNYFYT